MRRALAVAGALLTALLPAAPAAGGLVIQAVDSSAYPTIRVTVVTGRPLTRPPVLHENGNPLGALQATNLAATKSVVLAIDRSRSMAGQPLADALAGARAFATAMHPSDRVAVITVGRRVNQLGSFAPAAEAQAALAGITVDSVEGTALWDGATLAAEMLGGEEGKGRAVVLLTDGNNTRSRATVAAAAEAAQAAGAVVYIIGIEGPQFAPGPLRTLARTTGGSYVGARTPAALQGAYAAVATALKRTWQLEYATTARPGEQVMIRASGDRGTATAPLTLTDSGGSEDGGSSLLPAALLESAAGTLLFSLGVGLVVLLAASLAFNSVRGERLRRRLSPHLGDHRARLAAAERGRFAFLAGIFRATEGVFAHWRHWLALQSLLERAAIPLRTVEFVYVMVGCGLAAGILTALIFGSSAVGFLGLVGGAAAPLGFVLFKAKQRVRAFEDQLPDLLVGLAASLKAGHSFRHALQTVADEGRPPASLELNRVLTEARLGRPMEEALSEMAARVGSSNFDFVITSVNIQRQVGGSLAGLIDMVADTVRQRQQFERKIKGLTAMGRASAYVLMVLPFFMAGAITLINPGYMDPLFNTATGHKLILIGLLMMTFGCIAMRRIVSFRG